MLVEISYPMAVKKDVYPKITISHCVIKKTFSLWMGPEKEMLQNK